MENGKLHGDNTDGQGLVAAIQALEWNLENTTILILELVAQRVVLFIPLYRLVQKSSLQTEL